MNAKKLARREHAQSMFITIFSFVVMAELALEVGRRYGVGGSATALTFAVLFVINLMMSNEVRNLLSGKITTAAGEIPTEVRQWFETLKSEFNLTLELYTMKKEPGSKKLQAFTGGMGKKAVVVVSEDLIQALNPEQLMGVIAHEVGHQVNGDQLITVAALCVTLIARSLRELFLFFWLYMLVTGGAANEYFLELVFFAVASIFAAVLSAMISREREQMADAFAVANGYGRGLSEALQILKKRSPLQNDLLDTIVGLTGSHPPLWLRIRDIRLWLKGEEGILPNLLENSIVVAVFAATSLFGLTRLTKPYPPIYFLAPVFMMLILWMVSTPPMSSSELNKQLQSLPKRLVLWVSIAIVFIMATVIMLTLSSVADTLAYTGAQRWILYSEGLFFILCFLTKSLKISQLALIVLTAWFTYCTMVAVYSLF